MEKYTSPELEITIIDCNDVVTTSETPEGDIKEPVQPGIELPDDDLTK